MDEADQLITHVLAQVDPFEQGEILTEIDRGLNHSDISSRMSAEGYGPADRATAASILAQLRKDIAA